MPRIDATSEVPTIPDTSSEFLDVLVGQRQASFQFWLTDVSLIRQGLIAVSSTSTPSISNSIDRAIKRTLEGLEILSPDAEEVDPLNSRVEVEMVLSDGSTWPLGVFLFASSNRPVYDWGTALSPSLADQTTMLAQPSSVPISVRPNSLVADTMIEFLSRFSLPRGVVIEDSLARTGPKAAMVWPPGADQYTILTDLAAIAGYNAPYFDNAGVLQIVMPTSTVDGMTADHIYDAGPASRILSDTLVYSNDLLEAPNRWLVIDTSATDNAIFGSYDLPAADPGSASARGYVLTRVVDAQAIGSVDNAVARAVKEAKAYRHAETLAFSSPPDPRHDTFDTATVLDLVYREKSWAMPLKEGDAMTHDLSRSYE